MRSLRFRPWLDQCPLGGALNSTLSLHSVSLQRLVAAKSLQSDCATRRRQPTRLPRPWDSPGKNSGVGCHFLLQCMKGKSESEVTQSCPTLSDPMDWSLPGSSVHGIFQARVLEWGAIAFSDTGLLFRGGRSGKTSQKNWDGPRKTGLGWDKRGA